MRRIAWLVVLVGCKAVPVELDARFDSQAAVCDAMTCDAPPRCQGGGTDCLACLCCACTDGETRCSPDAPDSRWRCDDGCWVDDPCPIATACRADDNGHTRCDDVPVDCDALEPWQRIAVCGENEALCEQCGCYICDDHHGPDAYCDIDPTRATSLMSCTLERCYERNACPSGDDCIDGLESGNAACESSLDCDSLGCTGLPVCGDPNSCGPCGCCDPENGWGNLCGGVPDGDGWGRWLYRPDYGCYFVLPCAGYETCVYDTRDEPTCVPDNGGR